MDTFQVCATVYFIFLSEEINNTDILVRNETDHLSLKYIEVPFIGKQSEAKILFCLKFLISTFSGRYQHIS